MPSQRRPQRRGGRSGSGRSSRSSSAKTPKKPAGPIRELTPTLDPPPIESFREWEGLGSEIQEALAAVGITTPTPIQRLSIGPVLEGRDVIAKAETGTGKTLGFGAPMMAKIEPGRSTVLGLVLCPTRELAQQVADVIKMLGDARGIRVALVVGGDPMHPQINELQQGAQVVVGTPGRVLDLAGQRFLSFPWLEFAVLDEADKMFEIGFADDVRKILAMTPEERQTLMFSATFPPDVLALAREATRDPVEVATARGPSTVTSIDQKWCKVDEDERALTLIRMFEDGDDDDVFLVFCERRTDVDQLMRRLERSKFAIKALHGGYDQAARFRVMSAFRTGEVKCLVATDVASRGLDVDHVTHVINYSVPRELEDYTHRIGRTGRAGRQGTAITFVVPRDARKWREMIGRTDWDVEEFEPRRTRFRGRDEGERGRGRRDRDERRPSRDRAERDDDARPPRRREREEGEERSERRPRRGDGERGDRPRRDRDDRGSSEGRSERPRRDRGSREEGVRDRGARGERVDRGTREERDERTERGRSRRGRGGDDRETREQASRENRGRAGGEREDREQRPRRRARREDEPRPERTERPERAERTERPRRERATSERSEEQPFGVLPELEKAPRAGDDRDERPRKRRREERPRKERSAERKQPERHEPDGDSFGAGL